MMYPVSRGPVLLGIVVGVAVGPPPPQPAPSSARETSQPPGDLTAVAPDLASPPPMGLSAPFRLQQNPPRLHRLGETAMASAQTPPLRHIKCHCRGRTFCPSPVFLHRDARHVPASTQPVWWRAWLAHESLLWIRSVQHAPLLRGSEPAEGGCVNQLRPPKQSKQPVKKENAGD